MRSKLFISFIFFLVSFFLVLPFTSQSKALEVSPTDQFFCLGNTCPTVVKEQAVADITESLSPAEASPSSEQAASITTNPCITTQAAPVSVTRNQPTPDGQQERWERKTENGFIGKLIELIFKFLEELIKILLGSEGNNNDNGGDNNNPEPSTTPCDTNPEPSDTQQLSVAPSTVISQGPVQGCGAPGDAGNEKGVGKYCTKGGGECAGKEAFICAAEFTDATICSKPCSVDADCGSGAVCFQDTLGKGCKPIACDVPQASTQPPSAEPSAEPSSGPSITEAISQQPSAEPSTEILASPSGTTADPTDMQPSITGTPNTDSNTDYLSDEELKGLLIRLLELLKELFAHFLGGNTGALKNASFEDGTSDWQFNQRAGASGNFSVTTEAQEDGSNAAKIEIAQAAQNPWDVEIAQYGLAITTGKTYMVGFSAKAAANRKIDVVVQQSVRPFTVYDRKTFDLTPEWQDFTYTFTASDTQNNVFVGFQAGLEAGTVWVDDITFTQTQ
ncbi:MAG: carbohydrate binding domain-containing protein [Patescibacteria group bacterium]